MSLILSLPTSAATPNEYDEYIKNNAKKFGLDYRLIKAVIWRESKFQPDSIGKAGEIGLMQIKMSVARDWAKVAGCCPPSKMDMFDPELNIEIGTWYLARAKEYWSDYKYCNILALCEYNVGRKGMEYWLPSVKHGKIAIRNDRTRKYVLAILDKYIEYIDGVAVALNK